MPPPETPPSIELLRRENPACPRCGYDLSDWVADVCPECGFAVVKQAREDWAQNRLPHFRRNPVGSVFVAGLVPNVLLLPIAYVLAGIGGDSCLSVPLALIATVVFLSVWSRRLSELGKGPVAAFRESTPLYIALAWAWPVLLLFGPLVGPAWRMLTP